MPLWPSSEPDYGFFKLSDRERERDIEQQIDSTEFECSIQVDWRQASAKFLLSRSPSLRLNVPLAWNKDWIYLTEIFTNSKHKLQSSFLKQFVFI